MAAVQPQRIQSEIGDSSGSRGAAPLAVGSTYTLPDGEVVTVPPLYVPGTPGVPDPALLVDGHGIVAGKLVGTQFLSRPLVSWAAKGSGVRFGLMTSDDGDEYYMLVDDAVYNWDDFLFTGKVGFAAGAAAKWAQSVTPNRALYGWHPADGWNAPGSPYDPNVGGQFGVMFSFPPIDLSDQFGVSPGDPRFSWNGKMLAVVDRWSRQGYFFGDGSGRTKYPVGGEFSFWENVSYGIPKLIKGWGQLFSGDYGGALSTIFGAGGHNQQTGGGGIETSFDTGVKKNEQTTASRNADQASGSTDGNSLYLIAGGVLLLALLGD